MEVSENFFSQNFVNNFTLWLHYHSVDCCKFWIPVSRVSKDLLLTKSLISFYRLRIDICYRLPASDCHQLRAYHIAALGPLL